MKIVGLTGGIGSGKSTVANFFAALGVPVYIADDAGKYLLANSKVVKRKVIALLGDKAYTPEGPDKKYIAAVIFNNPGKLAAMNAIIHPKVGQHFKRWLKKQNGQYCIKEAAILFENGGYKQCDYTILVTAPEETRIARVQHRDNTSRKQIKARMENQWSDHKKIPLSDFVLENINLLHTKKEVMKIHLKLSQLSL